MSFSEKENLSFSIIGILYDVYNELGFGYQEKYYYRAVKIKLLSKGYTVKEQLLVPLSIDGQSIGRYFLDFLISNNLETIILEMKIANEVYSQHIRQVLAYLKANNLHLGLIGAFSKHGVIVKRVIL
jgi:GxxExxY protein